MTKQASAIHSFPAPNAPIVQEIMNLLFEACPASPAQFFIFPLEVYSMRFSVSTVVALAGAVAVATATEDACSQMCSKVDGCRESKYGSYCKGWMTPSTCFGLVEKADGSYCFQPGDDSCVGEAVTTLNSNI
ncbi:hypothetical protein FOZ63_019016 [Perkinsus olseni]|uniref:Uncharacterized protein n=1 Tax=Perkinsus olseni TaxID=32597 RepID=A0A7J6SZM6_PEROL|nr:hypothetical protein FOZ63_019016 [Perkinsus olseni]